MTSAPTSPARVRCPAWPTRRWWSRARSCSAKATSRRGIPACMACHSIDGRGNPGAMYPQLTSQHAQYIEATLKAWHDGTTWGNDAHVADHAGDRQEAGRQGHRRAGQLYRRPAQPPKAPALRHRRRQVIADTPASGRRVRFRATAMFVPRTAMLKRLPFLCAALLALAACSHDNNDNAGTAPQPAAGRHGARRHSRRPPRPPPRQPPPARPHRPPPAPRPRLRRRHRRLLPPRRSSTTASGSRARTTSSSNRPSPSSRPPGKIEVIEVFSYGCPACNAVPPTVEQMAAEPARRRRDELTCRPRSCRTRTGRCCQRAFLHRAGAGRGRQDQ